MAGGTNPGIIVFATKDVGRDAFETLVSSGTAVDRLYVVRPTDTETLDMAAAAGIPGEVAAENLEESMVREGTRYAWLLNLWADRIFSREFLNLFNRRLNLHPALVPHCRGNDCATWAIREQEPAGVSLIEMEAGIDAGAIYAQKIVPHQFPETAAALQRRLKSELVGLFRDRWPDILAGRVDAVPQTGEGSYHRRRDTVADRTRQATDCMTVEEMIDWVRAHDFAPDTTALVARDGETYRIRLDIERAD